MTTRSSRPVPAATVLCGADATCVAALPGALIPAGGAGGRGLLVGVGFGARGVSGRPCEAPGWVGGYRSVIGVEVDCGGC